MLWHDVSQLLALSRPFRFVIGVACLHYRTHVARQGLPGFFRLLTELWGHTPRVCTDLGNFVWCTLLQRICAAVSRQDGSRMEGRFRGTPPYGRHWLGWRDSCVMIIPSISSITRECSRHSKHPRAGRLRWVQRAGEMISMGGTCACEGRNVGPPHFAWAAALGERNIGGSPWCVGNLPKIAKSLFAPGLHDVPE